MISDLDTRDVLQKIAVGILYVGWYLFGLALLFLVNAAGNRDDIGVSRSFLTAAGWILTAGWLIRYFPRWWAGGRRRRRAGLNLFRLFRCMDRVEACFAPLAPILATPGGRICLGVAAGFVSLTVIMSRAF